MFNLPLEFSTAEEMQSYLVEEAMSQFPLVVDKVVPLADLGIEPRIFFHWKEKGIVEWKSTTSSQRQRIKLNLFDVVWVKIVKDLRHLGMSIPDIMILKKLLFTSVINTLKEIDEDTLQKIRTEISAQEFELIKIAIDNSKKMSDEMLESTGSITTYLGSLILGVIILKQKINLLLVKEGDELVLCVEGSFNCVEHEEYIEYAKTKPHINIPLNTTLEEFVKLESNEKHLQKLGLLTKNELEILDCIRNNDIREIILKKDQDRNITLTTKQDK